MFGGGGLGKTLVFTFLGLDKVSPAATSAGKAADKTAKKYKDLNKVVAAAGIAAGAAIIKFGVDSVKAASEAEEAQKKLGFAFAHFPKLADTSQAALQKLNSELQRKTKFDDDAIASGQAILAQFKLTGTQISSVTPLVLDYASRMGIDVPEASQNVGKALLGNAKALKNIGIKYQSTGDSTKDFANITALMREKIGGFAELEGKTAAGRAAILKNQFGELQETVGAKLIPVLVKATDAGLKVVDWVSRNQKLIVPLAGGILTVVAAVKTWIIVQKILNLSLLSNPVGLVIVALAGLAVGLVLAYKKSETFRRIVDGAFRAVTGAAQATFGWVKKNWPLILGIVTGPIGIAALTVIRHWDAIKTGARTAFAFVVDTFLGFVSTVITGAAKAFGWVPKLGPKLKTAASDFEQFRKDVNKKLTGINDQQVNITIKYTNTGVNLSAPSSVGRSATGGPIHGPGTGTSDTAGIFALSNNEHVVTAAEVHGAGGHGAVKRIRQLMLSGALRGLAGGGPAEFNLRKYGLNAAAVGSNSVQAVRMLVSATAKKVASDILAPSSGGGVLGFRGVRLDRLTIGRLMLAERMLGHAFRIMQGSYSMRVAASGSTHAGGGAMDTDNAGVGWGRAVAALRRARFAAWHRTPVMGPWGHHIHAIAIGDLSASPAAKAQVRDYLHGGDGLGGMRRGGPVLFARHGGILPPGAFAFNETNRSEVVLNRDQMRSRGGDPINYDRLAAALAAAITFRLYIDGKEIDARAEMVAKRLDARNAHELAVGRR